MSLGRWLGVVGCICLFAAVAQAQNTINDFSGGATQTNYTEYGQGTPGFVNNGPPGPANYYQLCASGVGKIGRAHV